MKALNRQYKSIHWEIIWVTALPNVVYHYEVYGSPIMVKLTFPWHHLHTMTFQIPSIGRPVKPAAKSKGWILLPTKVFECSIATPASRLRTGIHWAFI